MLGFKIIIQHQNYKLNAEYFEPTISSISFIFLYYIQGHSQRWSENNGLLLPKYESDGLPKPTGGSSDVVHLLIYASLVLG